MKLQAIGATRKQLHGSPAVKEEKDYEKEKVYPELELSGLLAEQMGAAGLKAGQKYQQKIGFEVKRHVITKADGKTSYSMTLCVVKASPIENAGDDDDDDEEEEAAGDDESEPTETSPALNYIHRLAKG